MDLKINSEECGESVCCRKNTCIPLGEGIYKVKAAKAEANIARYQLEDIKKKVELQVTQSSYKVNEVEKADHGRKNMEKAEENLRYANLGFKEESYLQAMC